MAKAIVKRVDGVVDGQPPMNYEDSQELMNDLATVKIAEFEESLEVQIQQIDDELKVLREDSDKVNKANSKLIVDFDYSDAKDKVSTFVKAAKELFNAVKATYSVPTMFGNKIVVNATIDFDKGDGYYRSHLSKSFEFDVTSDIKKNLEKMKDLSSQMATLNEKRAKLKIDLSKVDKVERRVKAVVVKQRLAKTEQGRSLMQQVKDIKALPGA